MSEKIKKSIMKNGRDYIRTEGGDINFNDPECSEVSILTIARHLSLSPRYNGCMYSIESNGQVISYTVGQHSLLVAECLPPQLKMAGLLHDASEAFLGDILSPIKNFLPDYKEKERSFENIIMQRFGISEKEGRHELVKKADKEVMATEMMFLGWKDIADYPTAPVNVDPLHPQFIFRKFIQTLFYLKGLRDNPEQTTLVEKNRKVPTKKLLDFWLKKYEDIIKIRSTIAHTIAEGRCNILENQKYTTEGGFLSDAEKMIKVKTQEIQILDTFLDCLYDLKTFTKKELSSITNERTIQLLENNKMFVSSFFEDIDFIQTYKEEVNKNKQKM